MVNTIITLVTVGFVLLSEEKVLVLSVPLLPALYYEILTTVKMAERGPLAL